MCEERLGMVMREGRREIKIAEPSPIIVRAGGYIMAEMR
jgi:hypothetical protein